MAVLIFISEYRLLHYSEGCTHFRLRIRHWWTGLLLWWTDQYRGEVLHIRQYDSHFKPNVTIPFFLWVNIINDSSSCPCKWTVCYSWNDCHTFSINLENYSTEQDTVPVNQGTNLKRVMCCMPHTWSDLFNLQ